MDFLSYTFLFHLMPNVLIKIVSFGGKWANARIEKVVYLVSVADGVGGCTSYWI